MPGHVDEEAIVPAIVEKSDELGRQGWELVGATPRPDHAGLILHFKRPVGES
jgi:hypothetical protein